MTKAAAMRRRAALEAALVEEGVEEGVAARVAWRFGSVEGARGAYAACVSDAHRAQLAALVAIPPGLEKDNVEVSLNPNGYEHRKATGEARAGSTHGLLD
eukprot:861666-Prorocentrum_minimum.AAC.1